MAPRRSPVRVDHPVGGERLVEVGVRLGGRGEQEVAREVSDLVIREPVERADGSDAIALKAHVDRRAVRDCCPNQEDAHCDATVAPSKPRAETRSRPRVGGTEEAAVVREDEMGVAEAVVERFRGCDVMPTLGESVRPRCGSVSFDRDRRARRIRPDREARRLLFGDQAEPTRGDGAGGRLSEHEHAREHLQAGSAAASRRPWCRPRRRGGRRDG